MIMSKMFCFQCQQTAGNSGCVRSGVCGKQPETANLQDKLICELILLAEAAESRKEYPEEATRLIADGLFTTLTNVNFDNAAITRFTDRVTSLRRKLSYGAERHPQSCQPDFPLGRRYGYCFPAFDAFVWHEGHGSLCTPRLQAGVR